MTDRNDQALAGLREQIRESERNDPLGQRISPTAFPYARLLLRAMEALHWAHERMVPHVPSPKCHVCASLDALADFIPGLRP